MGGRSVQQRQYQNGGSYPNQISQQNAGPMTQAETNGGRYVERKWKSASDDFSLGLAKWICKDPGFVPQSTVKKALALFELEENGLRPMSKGAGADSIAAMARALPLAARLLDESPEKYSSTSEVSISEMFDSAKARRRYLRDADSKAVDPLTFDEIKRPSDKEGIRQWLNQSSLGIRIKSEIKLYACPTEFITDQILPLGHGFLRDINLSGGNFPQSVYRDLERLLYEMRGGRPFELPGAAQAALAPLGKALQTLGLPAVAAVVRPRQGHLSPTQQDAKADKFLLGTPPWIEAAEGVGGREWFGTVPVSQWQEVADFLLLPRAYGSMPPSQAPAKAQSLQQFFGNDGVTRLLAPTISSKASYEDIARGNDDILGWVSKQSLPQEKLKKLAEFFYRDPKPTKELKNEREAMLAKYIQQEFPNSEVKSIPLDPRLLFLPDRLDGRSSNSSFRVASCGSGGELPHSNVTWKTASDDALAILPRESFAELMAKSGLSEEQEKYVKMRQVNFEKGFHVKDFEQILKTSYFSKIKHIPLSADLEQDLVNGLGRSVPNVLSFVQTGIEPLVSYLTIMDDRGRLIETRPRENYANWIEKDALLKWLADPNIKKHLSPATVALYRDIEKYVTPRSKPE